MKYSLFVFFIFGWTILYSQQAGGDCKPPEAYPANDTPFPFPEVYPGDDVNMPPNKICPGETKNFSVEGFGNFAFWQVSGGTLSCTDCLTTLVTKDWTSNPLIITVSLYEIPISQVDFQNDLPCAVYSFTLPYCGKTICPIVVTSSGTTIPFTYSDCDVPVLTATGPSTHFIWSPQIGLSCYDCPNPTLLQSEVLAENIPDSYTVQILNDNVPGDGPFSVCGSSQVSLSQVFCEDCPTTIVESPTGLDNKCVGDILTINAIGGDHHIWTSTLGGLNCTNCTQVQYTVQPGTSQFTVTSYDELNQPCGGIAFEISSSTNCLEVDGICYNNFGVNTNVYKGTTNIHLTIYGSILNEKVVKVGVIQTGTFVSSGNINVERDWINNSFDGFFKSSPASNGIENLFGNYQRIRGVWPTNFYNLKLNGNGKKEMFVNANSLNTLDLTINELATRNFVFYFKSANPSGISRTTGFVSSNFTNGGLSRKLAAYLDYTFPLGSSLGNLRYRPIVMKSLITNTVVSRLVNHDPSMDNLVNLAPDVELVNEKYYHEVKPVSPGNLDITFYYMPSDGIFQHVSQYDLGNDLWQKTGSIFAGLTPTTSNPYLPNLNFIKTTWNQFDTKYYVLSKAGFIIDWSNFGNLTGLGNSSGSGSGSSSTSTSPVVVTVTSSTGNVGGNLTLPYTAGTSGTPPFTPSPVQGTYTMSINGGDCIEDANITFTVDAAGNYVPNSFYFQKGTNVNFPLAESLYNLVPAFPSSSANAMFELLSIPESEFMECSDDVKIVLTDGISLVQGNSLNIVLPTNLTVNQLIIKNVSGTLIYQGQVSSWNSSGVPEGAYNYELTLINSSSGAVPAVLMGQFIIKI